ncbi:MAG: hypothetical protein ABEN55_19205, partial [Bradymonadaceae bacterium]
MVVALATACGGDPDPGNNGPGNGNNGDDDVIVNEDVRVLDETAKEKLAAFSLDKTRNEGELRFEESSRFARNAEVGRILVTEPVEGIAPSGFLQRVTSKRTENGQIILTTSQATLLETFDKADIRYEQTLDPGGLVETETRSQGIEMRTHQSPLTRRQSLGFNFGLDFNQVLLDADADESTTDDQLVLDGSLDFNASARGDIDIGFLAELDRFMFRVDLDESVNVEVRGATTASFDERIVVATYNFGSFTIWVGPVPVVFNVSMQIDVGAEGRFEASIVTRVDQSTSLTIGAEYKEDRGWRNLSDFDSDFSFTPPQISAAGSARGFVEPRVLVKIYGSETGNTKSPAVAPLATLGEALGRAANDDTITRVELMSG